MTTLLELLMQHKTEAQLSKWFWEGIPGILGTSLFSVIAKYQDGLARRLVDLPPLVVLWTLVILLFLVLILLTVLIFKRPWLYWDAFAGTWNNRLNNQRYCGVCRAKKMISPLKNESSGWSCVSCGKFHMDPTKQNQSPLRTYIATARMRT